MTQIDYCHCQEARQELNDIVNSLLDHTISSEEFHERAKQITDKYK